MRSRWFGIVGVGVVAVSVGWIVNACKSTGADSGTGTEDGAPARDYRVQPPSVEKATIEALEQPIEGGNVRFEVRFAPQEPAVKAPLTILVEDAPVVLRDDGAEGDREKGDGVLSAMLQLDVEALRKEQLASLERLAGAGERSLFVGREIVAVEKSTALVERLKKSPLFDPGAKLIGIPFDIFDFISIVLPADIDPDRSLVITDPGVVQDPERTIDPCTGQGNPNGAWTFKHLVTGIANQPLTGIDPAELTERWLQQWLVPHTVSSGFLALPRPRMNEILANWPRRPDGKLDLDRSPFRLAAIVNRIDLAESLVYGAGSAGEGRFVFGVLDRRPDARECSFLPFAVIFEYGVTRNGCRGLRSWAQEWVALSSLPLGSPAYNAALTAITEQFAAANAAPTKPNGSALNQLRTNENALDPLWELREFRIDEDSHLLFTDTTKQTPDESLNRTAVIGQFIQAHTPEILAGKHVVPDRFPPGSPFMAATSRASLPDQLGTHFQSSPPHFDDDRHLFSLATCSACHMRETDTRFLHVDPTTMPAGLSRFMTGSTQSLDDSPDIFLVSDPASSVPREFNDVDRRRVKLADLAGSSCIRSLVFVQRADLLEMLRPGPPPDPRFFGLQEPLRMTH